MAWPIQTALMIEPTESENKAEMDRLCDALLCRLTKFLSYNRTRGGLSSCQFADFWESPPLIKMQLFIQIREYCILCMETLCIVVCVVLVN